MSKDNSNVDLSLVMLTPERGTAPCAARSGSRTSFSSQICEVSLGQEHGGLGLHPLDMIHFNNDAPSSIHCAFYENIIYYLSHVTYHGHHDIIIFYNYH